MLLYATKKLSINVFRNGYESNEWAEKKQDLI